LSNKKCFLHESRNDLIVFPYKICQFALIPSSKKNLHKNIINRLNLMLSLGFEDEVKALLMRKNFSIHWSSMRCIGYSSMFKYLNNEISYSQLISEILNSTFQLAKRQMTWIKNWRSLNYLDAENRQFSITTLLTILNKYKYI